MNNLLMIIISVCLSSFGQVTLKIGTNRLGPLHLSKGFLADDIMKIARTPEILLGLLLFASSFFIWIKVISRSELSLAYPMASLGYVNVLLFSHVLFNEAITVNKIVGIAVIITGVFILNR